ncbi:hypothetical protein GCM10029992_49370 [Glycomyces albus]
MLVVAESFLPQVNGVTNSVCRVLEHLATRGHAAAVVAPAGPDAYAGAPVHRVGGMELPGYEGFTVGVATRRRLRRTMQEFRPDVVHVASPFVLGHAAIRAARALGIRTVSVYQTDVAGFARRYRLKAAGSLIEHRLRRIHGLSDLTLAPSAASLDQLGRLGVPRVRFWPRGIDTGRFAPERRSEPLRVRLLGTAAGPDATEDDVLVGYVGRLAKEKDLHHLRSVQGVPGVRLVLVGRAPRRSTSGRRCPGRCSRGPSTAMNSLDSWRLWTSSCTPAPTRPSASPCRKPSRPGFRRSGPLPAGSWTGSTTASTGSCTAAVTWRDCGPRLSGWPAMRTCGARWAWPREWGPRAAAGNR